MEIRIVSSDIDGQDLSREKTSHKYVVRCGGKADEQTIMEALSMKPLWGGLGEAWDRIFGEKS